MASAAEEEEEEVDRGKIAPPVLTFLRIFVFLCGLSLGFLFALVRAAYQVLQRVFVLTPAPSDAAGLLLAEDLRRPQLNLSFRLRWTPPEQKGKKGQKRIQNVTLNVTLVRTVLPIRETSPFICVRTRASVRQNEPMNHEEFPAQVTLPNKN